MYVIRELHHVYPPLCQFCLLCICPSRIRQATKSEKTKASIRAQWSPCIFTPPLEINYGFIGFPRRPYATETIPYISHPARATPKKHLRGERAREIGR